MQPITVKADRQTTSLFDFMFWTNVVVIMAIIVLNILNVTRVDTPQSQGTLVSAAEPQLVLIVSFAMILYLGYGCYNALATKKRLERVFVALDENGVSGYSLPHPATGEPGETFSVPYGGILSVSLEEVAITKKHLAPALKIETAEARYLIPAPERLKELINAISERMSTGT